VAFAARARVEAHEVGDEPRVAEILGETVGLLVEAAFAGVVMKAGDGVVGLVQADAGVELVVLNFVA
jgi:hypothetical protein